MMRVCFALVVLFLGLVRRDDSTSGDDELWPHSSLPEGTGVRLSLWRSEAHSYVCAGRGKSKK